MRAARMLLCTDMIASFFCSAKSQTVGNSAEEFESHSIALGMHPELRENGANPVLSDRTEFIANSMAGNLATQSF